MNTPNSRISDNPAVQDMPRVGYENGDAPNPTPVPSPDFEDAPNDLPKGNPNDADGSEMYEGGDAADTQVGDGLGTDVDRTSLSGEDMDPVEYDADTAINPNLPGEDMRPRDAGEDPTRNLL